jgi:hypothetical protein
LIFELSGERKRKISKNFYFHDVGQLPGTLKTALTAPDKVVFSATFSRFGAIELLAGVEALSNDKFEIRHRNRQEVFNSQLHTLSMI